MTKAYPPASVGKSYLKAMGHPASPRISAGLSARCARVVDERLLRRPHRMPHPTCGGSSRLSGLPFDVSDGERAPGLVVPRHRRPDRGAGHHRRGPPARRAGRPRSLREARDLEAIPALVQVQPRGDVLPVRASYGNNRSWGIGSNPVWSDEPLSYALPDVSPPSWLPATPRRSSGRWRSCPRPTTRPEADQAPRATSRSTRASETSSKPRSRNAAGSPTRPGRWDAS